MKRAKKYFVALGNNTWLGLGNSAAEALRDARESPMVPADLAAYEVETDLDLTKFKDGDLFWNANGQGKVTCEVL